MTMAALLLSSCATTIQDFQSCSPVPGNLGAACDNFLSSNQQILTEAQWEALIAQWQAQGDALECVRASTLGTLKAELEKLCSKTPCSYELQQAVNTAIDGLNRTIKIAATAQALWNVAP